MNEKEKILLLQLILIDIRGNWGWENEPRVPKALDLATKLGFENHIERIERYKEDDERDGRFFRTDHEYGGYIGMEQHHGLEKTICDKSDEFKSEAVKYLTYPDSAFEDWEQYTNTDPTEST